MNSDYQTLYLALYQNTILPLHIGSINKNTDGFQFNPMKHRMIELNTALHKPKY